MGNLAGLLLLSLFCGVRLCATDPIDSSLPGSPVPGILQARTLDWVAINDCLISVRGPLEMRAEQESVPCSRSPSTGLQTLTAGVGMSTGSRRAGWENQEGGRKAGHQHPTNLRSRALVLAVSFLLCVSIFRPFREMLSKAPQRSQADPRRVGLSSL